jgi:PEP-CTERM motif
MRSRVFSTFVGAGLVGLALSMPSVEAGTILVFGQDGTSNQFTATNNGSMGFAGGTTLSAFDIPVTITGIANSGPLPGTFPVAFFDLSAMSTSNAVLDGSGHVTQEFSGSFSVASAAGGGGTNYLSGTFQDAVFGEGTGLVMTSSGPLGVPTFTSDLIGALGQTRAISLSFTNVTPPAFVTANQTLGAFTSSVSGNFSAAPEPASLALLGIGMTALFAFRRLSKRRNRSNLPNS